MKEGDFVRRKRDGRLGIILDKNLISIKWADNDSTCMDWDFIDGTCKTRKICSDNFDIVDKKCILCDCECHCNK